MTFSGLNLCSLDAKPMLTALLAVFVLRPFFKKLLADAAS
jgi:hypothetical protein